MASDDFEGWVTLFPYYDLGGLWKIFNENDMEHRGANYFFPEKEKEMKICCWVPLCLISFPQNADELEYET